MSAAAAAALLPNSISSAMTRPHATTDSRLLHNLIKAERNYVNHLASTVTSASAAAAALKAWGTSEARDVADTSSMLADLLSEVSDAQANHLEAIKGYREALKDVADREASIRTVVKDRDILVSRLIKASKKNGDVAHAQRELTACEEVLEQEERALVGVKRRTFKEALSMRMKLMGDAGNRMVESAKHAILLLDAFDQHAGDDRRYYHDDQDGYSGGVAGGYVDQHQHQHQQQAYDGMDMHDQNYNEQQPYHAVPGVGGHHHHHQQHLDTASVTPSQSASQAAYGEGAYGNTVAANAAYQRPDFADGAPHESAEDRADSDASSEADEVEPAQAHYNDGTLNGNGNGNTNRNDAGLASFDVMPPPPPTKDAYQSHLQPHPDDTSAAVAPTSAPNSSRPREPRPASMYAQPQPQMHLPTAPRFDYDGVQMAPIPQAPRLYNRDDEDSSSDDEGPRGTVAHRGWGARPTRNLADDGSSDEGGAGAGRSMSPRPKAEKRGSFFGRVGKLFKTDIREQEAGQSGGSAHGHSASGSKGHRRTESADRVWDTRTDRNVKRAEKENLKATGAYQPARQSLLRPFAPAGGEDSSSDDEENRADLVRHVNPSQSLFSGERKANSDVGGTLRRTPSELARITAGPMSIKQRRELEARQQADTERQARDAVFGAGIGRPQRSSTITSSTTTATKKKKKKKASTASHPHRPASIAGSEIGTSATRATAPSATANSAAPGLQRHSSYIVHGDLSSGSRGLATLVLPSDLAKQNTSYPSIMPPTGLSRSNSTATAATGKASTIKKKKKRQSAAISQGPGTGLSDMSHKDGGKFNTSNWVQPHAPGGGGLAAQAVANAGLVPHSPAPQEQIAAKQASPAAQIQRPPSAQPSTPLKSALKHQHHPQQQQQSAPLPDASASLGPAVVAPPRPSAVLAEAERSPLPPVAAEPPRLPTTTTTMETPIVMTPQDESRPSLGEDSTFDGTGRLNMSRQNSTQGLDAYNSDAAGTATPEKAAPTERRRPQAPRLDMPASEPFNLDLASLQRRNSAQRNGSAEAVDPALLTPGERSAYAQLFASSSSSSEARHPSPSRQPQGVTRVTANRHKLGDGQSTDSDAELKMPVPSRTYSSETKPVERQAEPRAEPPAQAAPPMAAPLMLPQLTSGGLSDVSTATGTSVARRKSVRLAPDTKLPPETPPALYDGERQGGQGGFISDGFGGFVTPSLPQLPSIKAPGSALSGATSSSPHLDSSQSALQLSSRIAPPPQAPPRLPNKEAHPQLTNERERSGWSTRIDRRLASTMDSSDEEDGGADGSGGAGAGEDAYASARRAMGVAQRHWKDAVTPERKKKSAAAAASGAASTRSATGSASGSVKKKKSKAKKTTKSGVNDAGYNAAIPLPKGMEVVGRQKASQ